jgi:hypothetical protein
MGKKIRAAKASVVAAFLAAGGAATATGMHASAAKTTNTIGGTSVNWGDPLIRFLKLDGFPSYLKIDGFAQLTQFYKGALLDDAAALYNKAPEQVAGLLDLYQKANAGPLNGILIGLEQFSKFNKVQPLADYVKTDEGLANYVKFEDFFSALRAVDGDKQGGALDFFIKETGITSVPSIEEINGGGNTDGGIT